MKEMTNTINNYIDGLNKFKQGKPYHYNGLTYRVEFDPDSYDQVLLFFTENNGADSIQFAGTEMGIYIRDEDYESPSHYFYHTLMYTQDFGLTINDLANVHYIFQEMKKI